MIDLALEELVSEHENLNKLSSKIFHRARWVEILKKWSTPPLSEIIDAVDAVCANNLGLTTQVVVQNIYLTDGPTRIEEIGSWKIKFGHADETTTYWAGHLGTSIIQGLNWMGQPWIEANQDLVLNRLRKSAWRAGILPEHIKRDLQRNRSRALG